MKTYPLVNLAFSAACCLGLVWNPVMPCSAVWCRLSHRKEEEGKKRKVVEAGTGSEVELSSDCDCVSLGCWTSLCLGFISCKMGLINGTFCKGLSWDDCNSARQHMTKSWCERHQADGDGYHRYLCSSQEMGPGPIWRPGEESGASKEGLREGTCIHRQVRGIVRRRALLEKSGELGLLGVAWAAEVVDHCVMETRQLLKIFDQGDDLRKVVLEDETGRSIPDGLEEYQLAAMEKTRGRMDRRGFS